MLSPKSIVMACIAALSPTIVFADQTQDESQLVAKIKLLGGKVVTNDQLPGSPVTGISFDWSERFDDRFMHLLKSFPRLATVSFFRTRISDEGLKELRGLSALKAIDLGGCPGITDAGLAQLAEIKGLTSLSLRETSITDEGMRKLESFPNLTSLNLSGCRRITDAGVLRLTSLPRLKLLYLNRTAVTLEGLRELKRLESLRHLDVTGTAVNADGIKKLQRLLVDAKIVGNGDVDEIVPLRAPRKRARSLDLLADP